MSGKRKALMAALAIAAVLAYWYHSAQTSYGVWWTNYYANGSSPWYLKSGGTSLGYDGRGCYYHSSGYSNCP
jgi:hypothetical protein